MRIAVFIKSTTFHKGFGGFETQNQSLCEGLAKRGHEIIVFTPKKELESLGFAASEVRYVFIPCKFGSFRSLYSGNKNSWENQAYQYFIREHQDKHFDLVIGQSSWALPIIKHKKELGIKVISISHGTKMGEYQTELSSVGSLKDLLRCIADIPHILRAFFQTQREFIHGSDHIVAVSNFVKKAVIDETYVWDQKITVINNGVDSSRISVSKKKEKDPLEKVGLVYVGRIIRAKGLFKLIKALESIKESNFLMSVVGEGQDKNDLEKYVNQRDMGDRVNFLGLLKHEDVLEVLEKSDVFVLPTMRMEGFPMTIVEAMFEGLPIIASDIGGNSDAIENNETGFLVKAGDVTELSDKIRLLIKDPQKRHLMGENSRRKAQNEFTIDRMLDKYESVFEDLLK